MNAIVADVIPIRGRAALAYGEEGTVVMFDILSDEDRPVNGEPFVLERNDGWLYWGVVKDSRVLGDRIAGFFADGLALEDVPLGAVLRWRNELWPTRESLMEAATSR